jgi:hypothetical protein
MAERKGGFPLRSHWFLAAVVAAASAILAPGYALADTPVLLGSAATGDAPCWSGSGADAIPTSTASHSYSLPAAGTISSWSVQAPTAAFRYTEIDVGFELWRPTPLADGTTQYALVAFDAAPAAIPADGQSHAYTPAITIEGQKDDVVGLWQSGGSACGVWTGNAGDAYQTFDDLSHTWGTTIQQTPGSPMNGWELDVAATFVPNPTSEPLPIPATKEDCFDHKWGALVDNTGTKFKNQGDCVSYVENGNPAAGT